MRSGSEASFEWPAYATGWKIPHLAKFFRGKRLHDALFHDCALGLADQGKPVNKPYRIRTTCQHLSNAMSEYTCKCPPGSTHAPCQGAITSKNEEYIPEMAQAVIDAILNAHATSSQHPHGELGRSPQYKALISQLMCNITADDALDLSYATPPSEVVRGLGATFTEGGSSPSFLGKGH